MCGERETGKAVWGLFNVENKFHPENQLRLLLSGRWMHGGKCPETVETQGKECHDLLEGSAASVRRENGDRCPGE